MNVLKYSINFKNFEKIILGIVFLFVIVFACLKFKETGDVSSNWITVIMITGGLFTTRKIFSYYKPTQYYNTGDTTQIINKGEKIDGV